MIFSISTVLLCALGMGLLGIALSRLSQNDTIEAGSANSSSAADNATNNSDAVVIETVNSLLPQTQCAQCGYPGCRPYAHAIVLDDAPINQCPPGGDALITELAELLGTSPIALNTQHGENKPAQLARIDESECIGCTLCIAACPVDAIVGASKLMHTVIDDQCTGCELCIPPCPVDCIELTPTPQLIKQWQWPAPG